MQEYMKLFKEYLGEDRKTYTKAMFKIAGSIYRGVINNRFTLEQAINVMGGIS